MEMDMDMEDEIVMETSFLDMRSTPIAGMNNPFFEFLHGTVEETRKKKKQKGKKHAETDETTEIWPAMNSSAEGEAEGAEIKVLDTTAPIPEKAVRYYNVPLKSGIIALMNHPASLPVYQYVSIQVLSGSASVMGYEINTRSRPVEVFSSEKTGLIEIKTETFESIWKKKGNLACLEKQFLAITDNKRLTNKILRNLGNFAVAVFIRRCAFPVNLQFLELYYPSALDFNLYKKAANKLQIYIDDRLHPIHPPPAPLQFGLDVERLLAKITMLIRSAKLAEIDAPRIIVCGPRNVGKSSLIRYLMNKILTIYTAALYLDTDPGQTEFTPPGTVSLSKVTKPILSPSFCHQRNPLLMVFTGSTSPTSPDMHSKGVAKLMKLYFNKYRDEPLFVNTMGWMEGLGLKCLENVIDIVKPTMLVEIASEEESSMFDYRDLLPNKSTFTQLNTGFKRSPHFPPFSAKDMRNFALLSYFGKCQSPFFGPVPLNEVKPYCVSWDKIPLFLSHQKVQPYRILEAVSQSVVALCVVPEPLVLESDIPQFPKTLEDDPDNECLGFGFVRAVDELNHLLYIVTPLKINELKKVNAIICGNILMPDAVFLKQAIYEEPIPFVCEKRIEIKSEKDEKDYSSVSVRSPEPDAKPLAYKAPHGSADLYSKTIPPRYKKNF